MAIFDDLPGLIGDVLTDLGANEGLGAMAVLTQTVTSSYDPATGAAATTPQRVEVRVIMEDVQGKEFIDGLVQAGDKKFLIAGEALDDAPLPGCTIEVAAQTFTATRVVTVQPGAEVVLYEVFCRQS